MPDFLNQYPDIKVSVYAMPNENVVNTTARMEK